MVLIYKKSFDISYTGNVTGTSQGVYKNGKPDGLHIIYYDNGKLSEKVTYKYGEKNKLNMISLIQ